LEALLGRHGGGGGRGEAGGGREAGGSGAGAGGAVALSSPATAAPAASEPLRVLELCCGTGASLAFMCRMGFSVTGVELVPAACRVAAARLQQAAADVAAAVAAEAAKAEVAKARGMAAAAPAPVAVPVLVVEVRQVQEAGGATYDTTPYDTTTTPPPSHPHPHHLLLQGDLFAARLPPAAVHLVYDCQGLHAVPPQLRVPYVAVLHAALRRGGLALLLVGRSEEEGEEEGVREEEGLMLTSAGRECSQAKGCDAGDEDGRRNELRVTMEAKGGAGVISSRSGTNSSASSSSRGPSLLSLPQLRSLFPPARWRWCGCWRSVFDATPEYDKLAARPPAWCLLVRKL
ncbi:hypothetical protein Agub_g11702, partial [Astrephomene gubernaculifera]